MFQNNYIPYNYPITLFDTTYFNFQTAEINLYILTHLYQRLTKQELEN